MQYQITLYYSLIFLASSPINAMEDQDTLNKMNYGSALGQEEAKKEELIQTDKAPESENTKPRIEGKDGDTLTSLAPVYDDDLFGEQPEYMLSSFLDYKVLNPDNHEELREKLESYSIAAEKGDMEINLTLAEIYRFGLFGEPLCPPTSFNYYKRAAQSGSLTAQYIVAKAYLKGKFGQSRNEKKALELYQQAAAQGNIPSLCKLGVFYIQGRCGLPKDVKKSMEYYHKAIIASKAQKFANLTENDLSCLQNACNLFHLHHSLGGIIYIDKAKSKQYSKMAKQYHTVFINTLLLKSIDAME